MKKNIMIIGAFLLIASSLSYGQKVEEVVLEPEIFISVDYIFNNEGLNRPYAVKWHEKTKELFVSDFGNNCIYVFSEEGKYKRQFGRAGQGPGDLLEPLHIDIGNNDLLYVYENGNSRISIFDVEGKFLNFVRTGSIPEATFALNNNEIIINRTSNGYLFTVYSSNGNEVNRLGEIADFTRTQLQRSWGIPFVLNNGNYGIVLQSLGLIKIYSPDGNLLNEVKLQNIFSDAIPRLKGVYSRLPDRGTITIFWDVRYYNNKLFMLKSGVTADSKPNFNILMLYILDDEFKVTNIISLKYPFKISNEPPRRIRYNTIIYSTFEVVEERNIIFLPIQDFATVCIYKY